MAPSKVAFALSVRASVTAFMEAVELIAEKDQIFSASEYNSGGGNQCVAGTQQGDYSPGAGDLCPGDGRRCY